MVGTINDDEYLQDATGNRRFWPVRVTRIDLQALQRDRDQLWAEAAHCEAQGESLLLPKELWPRAAIEQAARLVEDPWEDVLRPLLEGKKGTIRTSQIWVKLDIEANRQDGNVGSRLKKVMMKLGFRRTQRRHGGKPRSCYTNTLNKDGEETEWLSI
jgi:predicted P-loop ATPase